MASSLKTRAALWLALLLLAAPHTFGSDHDTARVRLIILSTQHLGAHGLGYGTRSLNELSKRLHPQDIPTLIELAQDRTIYVGAQFALASQCQASLDPVTQAVNDKKIDFLDAEDIMDLIGGFTICSPDTREQATALKQQFGEWRVADEARIAEESKQRDLDDQRIQTNGLKMLDPDHRGELTRQEREEVFHRSIKAAGLEDPTTPEQKAMVDRMYRAMVLGESGKSSNAP